MSWIKHEKTNINLLPLVFIAITFQAEAQFSNYSDGTGFIANLESAIVHDSNIYRVPDEYSDSDQYLKITPEIKFIKELDKQKYEIIYKSDIAKFREQHSANYDDHLLSIRAGFDHTYRFSSFFEYEYVKDHEEPGSLNRIQLDIVDYNKFSQNFFKSTLVWGKENSKGQIKLSYIRNKRNYKNNGLDFLDSIRDELDGTFFYRVAPKTRAYFQYAYAKYDYEASNNYELDNVYKRLSLGAVWDTSEALSGDVNIGYQNREYDLTRLQDIDGFSYDANVFWNLKDYSQFAFFARRESIDSSIEEVGGFLRTSFGLEFQHEFTEKLSIDAGIAHSKDELVFDLNRTDKRDQVLTEISYVYSPILKISCAYSYEDRTSTLAIANFKSNKVMLNIDLKLDN
ncbi:outer membrane beta-barrel protein [Alteromonas sp. NFXS44]|uniref:outer membrane beta-barrel protein n=1 Tax=Alteromonas sp. NFXS44 TaxID=2818435 RepID=UPI0032E04B15